MPQAADSDFYKRFLALLFFVQKGAGEMPMHMGLGLADHREGVQAVAQLLDEAPCSPHTTKFTGLAASERFEARDNVHFLGMLLTTRSS